MRTRSRSPRYTVTTRQHDAILNAASQLSPELRHSFLLRVELSLQVNARSASVTDGLVAKAIEKAYAEVS